MSSITNPGFFKVSAGPQRQLPRLSVIIVTWNVCDFLHNCLASLQNAGIPQWADVIVVDNASTDETVEMVRHEFSWARVIETGNNLGFSRANNLAIRETTSEYVLLLNPDTVVYPGALERLVERADADPRAGALGPKQIGSSGAVCYDGAVAIPTVWNVFCDYFKIALLFPRSRIFNSRLMGYWDHESDREVPGVPGTAMFLRRTALDQVGLLDEHLHYVEDMDLCLRLHQCGWQVQYVASSVILHYGGESFKRAGNNALRAQIAFHSLWLFLCKQHGRATAMALSCVMFFWSLALILPSLPVWLLPPWRRRAVQWFRLGVGMLRWSLGRKFLFQHHLATPVRTVEQMRKA